MRHLLRIYVNQLLKNICHTLSAVIAADPQERVCNVVKVTNDECAARARVVVSRETNTCGVLF
jgi:hypothetical protein